jgi:hypothetical protein
VSWKEFIRVLLKTMLGLPPLANEISGRKPTKNRATTPLKIIELFISLILKNRFCNLQQNLFFVLT